MIMANRGARPRVCPPPFSKATKGCWWETPDRKGRGRNSGTDDTSGPNLRPSRKVRLSGLWGMSPFGKLGFCFYTVNTARSCQGPSPRTGVVEAWGEDPWSTKKSLAAVVTRLKQNHRTQPVDPVAGINKKTGGGVL